MNLHTLPALPGASVALLALILALSASDVLDATLWTAFAHPASAIVEVELLPYWRMRDSIEWFVGATWPLLALAAIGAVSEVLLRRTVLGWQIAGWLAGGVAWYWRSVSPGGSIISIRCSSR